MSYCTLDEARAEIKAQSTVDDEKLLRHIRVVSRRIDTLMAPRSGLPLFEPYYEQRAIPLSGQAVNSSLNAFFFRAPLLSLSSISVSGSDVTSSVEAYPLGVTPIRALRFVDGANSWYQFPNGVNPVYVTITGTWGIRVRYESAWVAYDTIQTNPMAPGDTSFVVADVDGDDPYGIGPRFSPGQLIRIGSGPEMMLVASTTVLSNTVTVQRQVNGTSLPAGNYAAGSTVYVFQPEDPIRRVVARQAALMVSRQGAFQVETLDGVGAITYPQDLLVELKDTLTEYMYV